MRKFAVLVMAFFTLFIKSVNANTVAANAFFEEINTINPTVISPTVILYIELFILLGLLIGITILYINFRSLKAYNISIENINSLRKTFIDADDSLIYLKDETLKYVFVNESFHAFLNLANGKAIGCHNEFTEKHRQTDLAVLETKKLISYESEWQNRIYKTTKFPVEMLNGRPGVGSYMKDITEEYRHAKIKEKILNRNQILINVFERSFDCKQKQLDYVLEESLKLTESKFGYICLYDEGNQKFILNSWSMNVMDKCNIIDNQINRCLEKSGLCGEVARRRKPIIINDFEKHSSETEYRENHIKLNRVMSIPVIIDGEIVAIVGLANKKEEYDENDVSEMTILMSGIWNAVERRAALDKLSFERNKFLQTLISIGDAVLVVDQNGNVEMLNLVAEKLTGWTIEEAYGKHYKKVFVLSHEDEKMTISDPIEGVFRTDTVQELGNHAMLTSKSGHKYYLEDSAAPIKDENNNTVGVVLVFRDVTEKKDQRKKIEYLSFHDSLTGLYNRRYFEDALIRIDTEENLPISVVLGDVNGLKLTNDIFGHVYGDMLLEKVAEVFKKVCRSDDIIARWGGDEFVVLLPETSLDETQNIINNIKDEFSKEKIKAIKGSISMGCETKCSPEDNLLLTLEKAEEKMYNKKTVERDESKSAIIYEIIKTLHENNPCEKSHSENVSKLCEELGVELKLSKVEIRRLKDAGYYHDIGKIILDPKILNKKHSKTSHEWREIKKHPIIGYRILNSIDETLDLAEAVLAHQEYWDGTGYPKGLKGEEIPKLARIITIVEKYERMVYGLDNVDSLTAEEAIQFIRSNIGVRFDPEISAAFIKMIETKNKIQ